MWMSLGIGDVIPSKTAFFWLTINLFRTCDCTSDIRLVWLVTNLENVGIGWGWKNERLHCKLVYLLKNVFFTKGLLHAKLDHLYAICAAENSPVFQSYMVSPCKQNIFEMKDMKTQISNPSNMVMRLHALLLNFHALKPLLEGLWTFSLALT